MSQTNGEKLTGNEMGASAPITLQHTYNSPAIHAIHNESVNGSFLYGGCVNSYSPWGARMGGSIERAPHNKFRTSTPRRYRSNLDSVRMRLADFNDNSFASPVTASRNSFNSSIQSRSSKSTLPSWAVDGEGNVGSHVTLNDILVNNSLFEFATDKNGCRFLQEQYPADSDGGIHDEIFRKMVEDREIFLTMCRNMFGNFFVQRIVECSHTEEQEIVMEHLLTEMFWLCLDKSACRVIQLAIQKLDIHLASRLALQLANSDLVRLSIDQNGNHVIQKIIKTLPVSAWGYVIEFFENDEHLIAVCQDKYGCRVIQSTIEKLSENPNASCYQYRSDLLRSLMLGITRNCAQLASNEFANYVIQHVIKSGGILAEYRDTIIENCLLSNLLSMSQEKYASHVVEVAFLFAPHRLLFDMMEEIFEGYIPHPETNRDALDILLFHQYGNYIIQQMIHICCSAILGRKERCLEKGEIEQYQGWMNRIRERVLRNTSKLERFSSGKKIIEALEQSLPAGYSL